MLEQGPQSGGHVRPAPLKLFKSAFLTAVTNPKATMFFTALFPQFIDQGPRCCQFLTLTGIFVALSLTSLSAYAALGCAGQRGADPAVAVALGEPGGGHHLHRFGAAILAMRRQGA
jgi:threonine/homoserine/homoserine lactone efflux protein